jgi:hypothetical protein
VGRIQKLEAAKSIPFSSTHFTNPEPLNAYYASLVKARDAYRAQAVSHTANPAPRTSRGGGGTEYAIVLNISLYSAIGSSGILGLVIVALAIRGMLYVLGCAWITKRQQLQQRYRLEAPAFLKRRNAAKFICGGPDSRDKN